MKLTVDGFMDILAWVSGFYTNFNFKLKGEDGKPSMQFHVWYEVLREFDEDTLMAIVKQYCKENIYPPSSPTSLLEYAKTRLMKIKVVEIDKAWEDLMKLIALHGYNPYQTWNPIKNDVEMVYPLQKALENHENKILKKVYDTMSSKIRAMTDFSKIEILKEFTKTYSDFLSQQINTNVNQGILEIKNIKLLGE
jgi:hypothetical protein